MKVKYKAIKSRKVNVIDRFKQRMTKELVRKVHKDNLIAQIWEGKT